MLKKFCKNQKSWWISLWYNWNLYNNSFIGEETFFGMPIVIYIMNYWIMYVWDNISLLAFNHLFNQIYEKEYMKLNSERKEIYKPVYNLNNFKSSDVLVIIIDDDKIWSEISSVNIFNI